MRADVHFDRVSNVVTAMLEVPGVKKHDLRFTLSVCPYTRVKQLSISGVSRPAFPFPEPAGQGQGHESSVQVQERNFGEFSRTLVVPPETQVRVSLLPLTRENGWY